MAFFASTILSVILYRFVPVVLTPMMVLRCVQQLKEGRDLKLSHHWVPLERISVDMPAAVMAGEDARFLDHHGFDRSGLQLLRAGFLVRVETLCPGAAYREEIFLGTVTGGDAVRRLWCDGQSVVTQSVCPCCSYAAKSAPFQLQASERLHEEASEQDSARDAFR